MRSYVPRDMVPVPVETPLTDEMRVQRAKAMGARAGRTNSTQSNKASQRRASNQNKRFAEMNRQAAKVARAASGEAQAS